MQNTIFRNTFFLLLIAIFSCAQEKKQGNTTAVQAQGGLLDVNAFSALLDSTADKQVVDVRTREEFEGGYIPGAKLIDFYAEDFSRQLDQLDPGKPVFVYCKGGGRSAQAAQQMKQKGFKTVYDLKGGFMAWENAGKNKALPLITQEKFTPPSPFSSADLKSLIAGDKPVLIDFYAEWCQPCKKMAPALELLEKEFSGKIIVRRINVDWAKEVCKELGVEILPDIRTYKNGKPVAVKNGYQDEEQLRKLIAELLK